MKTCKHASCGDVCKFPPKEKKVHRLKRTPLKKKFVKIQQRTPIKKNRKRIKTFSKKRQAENVLYFQERDAWIEKNPECAIRQSPNCSGVNEHPHHPQGRGKNLRNWATMIPSCDACNGWVESNSAEAEKLGFRISRHKTPEGYVRTVGSIQDSAVSSNSDDLSAVAGVEPTQKDVPRKVC